MSYYVKALSWKNEEPKWKVQFVSYKKDHIRTLESSKVKKPKKTWDVEKDRWRALGFYKSMTIGDARERAKQINAQNQTKAQEGRIKLEPNKQKDFQERFISKLPEEFVSEFEKRFVTKTFLSKDRNYDGNRFLRLWKAAQKLILAIEGEPSEWYFNLYDFYDYFTDRQLSVRYMNEILKFANLWGFFICKKMGQPFLQVPRPGGYEKRRIIEAYFEKTRTHNKVSGPISEEALKHKKNDLREDLYNWIYLTVWFGLRPKEVDNLHDENLWRVESFFNGRKVLWVYQTKVIALPEEDRWKPIPILYQEQEHGIKILEANNFTRPLVKSLRFHFGKTVSLYGGRKAFTGLNELEYWEKRPENFSREILIRYLHGLDENRDVNPEMSVRESDSGKYWQTGFKWVLS
ncbi:MAG: hypothetical protein HYV97_05110 [Bdellovibrio sp.]|nr:hypothetical protein [Bdellovibrio sp.]